MVGSDAVVWPARSELAVLVSQYGKAQTRCSRLIADQAALIEALLAEQMRLRAKIVIRVTALQFEREDRACLEAMVPGLPRRAVLARQIDHLRTRLEALLRERTRWRWGAEERRELAPQRAVKGAAVDEMASAAGARVPPPSEEPSAVPLSVAAAQAPQANRDEADFNQLETELLICRTGCMSHGDYWRVQDHCRRTGRPCVLIDEHRAIHAERRGDSVVVQACPVRSFDE